MSNEESERITTSQDVISRLHDKIDEQHARIAELEADNASLRGINSAQDKALAELDGQLEAIGAGGVESLRKRDCGGCR